MDNKSIELFYGSFEELSILKRELKTQLSYYKELESNLALKRARLRISKKKFVKNK